MSKSKLDVSHSRLQYVFSELSEPCSIPERVPLLERKEGGLNR